MTIINDSKSTSFSSSIGILKSNPNIYWLLGGMYKKGDKFDLPKNIFQKLKLLFLERIEIILIVN